MQQKLIIDVARLKVDGEEFEGALDERILELHDELVRPFAGLRYRLFAQRLGSELLVRGCLAQDFEAVCSRCGGDFDFTVKVGDFTTAVETNEKTEFVDLTDELRESIILGLPTYPVCREDCRGVCPTCHKNLNEGACSCAEKSRDGRWGALDALELI